MLLTKQIDCHKILQLFEMQVKKQLIVFYICLENSDLISLFITLSKTEIIQKQRSILIKKFDRTTKAFSFFLNSFTKRGIANAINKSIIAYPLCSRTVLCNRYGSRRKYCRCAGE